MQHDYCIADYSSDKRKVLSLSPRTLAQVDLQQHLRPTSYHDIPEKYRLREPFIIIIVTLVTSNASLETIHINSQSNKDIHTHVQWRPDLCEVFPFVKDALHWYVYSHYNYHIRHLWGGQCVSHDLPTT